MNVKKIILVNANDFFLKSAGLNYHFSLKSEPHLGLTTINNALKQVGFSNTYIFPEQSSPVKDLEKDQETIVGDLRKLGADEQGAIIGISVFSDDYLKFLALSKIIRKEFPKTQILAGGSHFVRENIPCVQDPVETVLANNLVDAVIVGHASPFIDFITQYQGNLELVDSLGFYKWDSEAKEVYGQGYGKIPPLEEAPYIYYDRKNSRNLKMIWDAGCFHQCGFCSIPMDSTSAFSIPSVINGLHQISKNVKHYPHIIFRLTDSNPFETNKLKYYETILESFPDEGLWPPKAVFLNPSTLSENEQWLINVFQKHYFYSFFVGRDVVSEQKAQLIERNYKGKPKIQSQLDTEREKLKEFIARLKTFSKETNKFLPKYRSYLKISYILTPFETYESALAMIDEMEMFANLSDEYISVSPSLLPLMPYPRTRLRMKFLDKIKDPNDYTNLFMFANPWKEEIGPSVDFYVFGQTLLVSEKKKTKELFEDLKSAAKYYLPQLSLH